jgi:hypothetical protein
VQGNDRPSKGGIDSLAKRIKGPTRRKNKVEYASGGGGDSSDVPCCMHSQSARIVISEVGV